MNQTSQEKNTSTKEVQSGKKKGVFTKPWVQSVLAIIIIFGALFGFIFWEKTKDTVFVENSFLVAPIVNLSPSTGGILNALYVKTGDTVDANTPVALVGSQIIYAKQAGIVSKAEAVLGNYFSPGQAVVSLVNVRDMKVVGSVEETKGLKDIAKGDRVTFTVDAFKGASYEGVVDEVSPTSVDTGVVFSISDKRPIKKFEVTALFDVARYPELRNGMSAKMTIHTR
jgi:multidrug resistance efflux pump